MPICFQMLCCARFCPPNLSGCFPHAKWVLRNMSLQSGRNLHRLIKNWNHMHREVGPCESFSCLNTQHCIPADSQRSSVHDAHVGPLRLCICIGMDHQYSCMPKTSTLADTPACVLCVRNQGFYLARRPGPHGQYTHKAYCRQHSEGQADRDRALDETAEAHGVSQLLRFKGWLHHVCSQTVSWVCTGGTLLQQIGLPCLIRCTQECKHLDQAQQLVQPSLLLSETAALLQLLLVLP